MEVMITAFVMLGCLFAIIGGLYVSDVRRQNKREAILKAEIAREVARRADEERVKELEAEIFGIGVEIRDLPGCTWKLTRGVYYKRRSGEIHDVNGIKVHLMGEHKDTLRVANVYSFIFVSGTSMYDRGRYEDRTVEEIEQEVQKTMKNLVEKEISNRKYEAGMKNILETYNGKEVVVE
jgi:hypothetical protein